MGYLCFAPLSVMTAANVVSLPVPAVVSTAMSRGNFLQMRSNPFILWIGLLGFTIQAPVTLAQSMAEPPPKAMIAFVPLSRYSVLASSILVMVGFATTLS